MSSCRAMGTALGQGCLPNQAKTGDQANKYLAGFGVEPGVCCCSCLILFLFGLWCRPARGQKQSLHSWLVIRSGQGDDVFHMCWLCERAMTRGGTSRVVRAAL